MIKILTNILTFIKQLLSVNKTSIGGKGSQLLSGTDAISSLSLSHLIVESDTIFTTLTQTGGSPNLLDVGGYTGITLSAGTVISAWTDDGNNVITNVTMSQGQVSGVRY